MVGSSSRVPDSNASVVGIGSGRIATQADLDDQSIPGDGGVIPGSRGDRVAAGGERGIDFVRVVSESAGGADEVFLDDVIVDDFYQPAEAELVAGASFGASDNNADILRARDCLASLERGRDPLADEAVRGRTDRAGAGFCG